MNDFSPAEVMHQSRNTSAHSYLRTRADDRDAAEHLRVSEPRGSPALSLRNKDTQSTASLKPCFKNIKQLQIQAQPPLCLPTPKETLPLVMLCRLATPETQPA